jgi:signal peptidase I
MAASFHPPPAPARSRIVRVVLAFGVAAFVLSAAGGVGFALWLHSLGIGPGSRTVHVIGSAMAPAVRDGDYLLLQPYGSNEPRVGDIVEMRDPYDSSRFLVKRVVAVPGERVQIRGARLLVSGAIRNETYLDPAQAWTAGTDWPPDGAPVTLGLDEYFVLGDNRDDSADSRTFGPVRRDGITARALRILAPSQDARAL